jgi:hypothetical protein
MEKQYAATITNRNKNTDIKILFSPMNYQLNEGNKFSEVPVPGRSSPPLQYSRGSARTVSMQLFFDSYDPISSDIRQGSDVRDQTKPVLDLLAVDPDTHAPPLCEFSWGLFSFKGVLEKADQHFTMFDKEGTPVRATVDVVIKEVGQDQPQQQRFSADVTKQHVVRRGDTLSGIATKYFEDPSLWREIARANNLDDPLSIEPGQVLVIPALTQGPLAQGTLSPGRTATNDLATAQIV